jgi:hypothetical protein
MRHPTDIGDEEDCVFEQGNVDIYPPLPTNTPPVRAPSPTTIVSTFSHSPSPPATPRSPGSSTPTPRAREDQLVGYWRIPVSPPGEPSSYDIDIGQGVRRTVMRTAVDDAIDAVDTISPRNEEVMRMMRERFGWSGLRRSESYGDDDDTSGSDGEVCAY